MRFSSKLWLDDIRDPVKFGHIGWIWVKTVADAKKVLQEFVISQASLDHDLSIVQTIGGKDDEETGYDLVCWMEENMVFPKNGVHVHSANPAGAKRMADGLKATCRRMGLDEKLVTVWPADMDRPPREGEDPYNIMW